MRLKEIQRIEAAQELFKETYEWRATHEQNGPVIKLFNKKSETVVGKMFYVYRSFGDTRWDGSYDDAQVLCKEFNFCFCWLRYKALCSLFIEGNDDGDNYDIVCGVDEIITEVTKQYRSERKVTSPYTVEEVVNAVNEQYSKNFVWREDDNTNAVRALYYKPTNMLVAAILSAYSADGLFKFLAVVAGAYITHTDFDVGVRYIEYKIKSLISRRFHGTPPSTLEFAVGLETLLQLH